ncbi:unnamed protein product [Orchesella dallaii]|uniref:Phospholipid scramblase n=1 Tax=Orchesella dallaii TaxID=48710 RepID=A0ABP1Q996_9HEXA
MYSGRMKNNMVHPAEDDNYFFGETYGDYDYAGETRLQIGSGHLDSASGVRGNSATSIRGSRFDTNASWTDEIQALTSCDQFYLYQANKFSPDIASNYDIRNGEGKLIFKAVESIDPVVKDLHEIHEQTKPPFVLSIIEMKTGKEVMKINGNLARGVMMVYAKQYSSDKIVGLVRKVNERCSMCYPPIFSLERPNGAVLLKIRSSLKSLLSCCCLCACRLTSQFQTRYFNVYLSDDVTYIGEIKHLRKKFNDYGDPEANRTKAVLCASIPGDTISANKALLLASMFMIDFIYFQKHRRSLSCPKISKTCSIILIIVIAVCVIAAMAILFGGGGYTGERTNKGKTPKG